MKKQVEILSEKETKEICFKIEKEAIVNFGCGHNSNNKVCIECALHYGLTEIITEEIKKV